MRTLLFTIFFCLSTALAFGGQLCPIADPGSYGGEIDSSCSGCLLQERLESGSQTWGGDSNNEINWDTVSGSLNADNSTSPIEGLESCSMGSSSDYVYTSVSGTDNKICFGITVDPKGACYPFAWYGAGGYFAGLSLEDDGSNWDLRLYYEGDAENIKAENIAVNDTTDYIYVKVCYNNGSGGSGGSWELYHDVGSSFSSWTSAGSDSNSTDDEQIINVKVKGGPLLWDDFRVSTTESDIDFSY